MPLTVRALLQSAGLTLTGSVQWKQPVRVAGSGVYLVSLSPDPSMNAGLRRRAPIDPVKIEEWLKRVPTVQLDGQRAEVVKLQNRLARFWLRDENVIYVGKATSLEDRIAAFYNTPLGNRGPHAGGHWLKTLTVLAQAHVYFAVTVDPARCEFRMLTAFSQGMSASAKSVLHDPSLPLPFANLKLRRRKLHGLSRQTEPRRAPRSG
jgi:hypothetical protein